MAEDLLPQASEALWRSVLPIGLRGSVIQPRTPVYTDGMQTGSLPAQDKQGSNAVGEEDRVCKPREGSHFPMESEEPASQSGSLAEGERDVPMDAWKGMWFLEK